MYSTLVRFANEHVLIYSDRQAHFLQLSGFPTSIEKRGGGGQVFQDFMGGFS